MNYYAILLYKRKSYAENDAFELVFQIYSDQNELQTSLTDFKFQAKITNDFYSVTKQDINYTDGAVTQISISGDKVTVHIVTDDTTNFDGDYILEFQLEKILDATFRQTVYRGNIRFYSEELED